MRLFVADHPLIDHKMSKLRDETTPPPVFRDLVSEILMLLSYEATRDLTTEEVEIVTPVEKTTGRRLTEPVPLIVPILRAGLGMLHGMSALIPTAEIGFLGIRRDEETFEPVTYANQLPDDLTGRQCYVLDPMLATGGSLVAGINYLLDRGAKDVTAVCIIAAPEGIQAVANAVGDRPNVKVVVAVVDEGLNADAYIVPGLGDAGDRLYGAIN
jgi:uracil phosphoribosyltransferase